MWLLSGSGVSLIQALSCGDRLQSGVDASCAGEVVFGGVRRPVRGGDVRTEAAGCEWSSPCCLPVAVQAGCRRLNSGLGISSSMASAHVPLMPPGFPCHPWHGGGWGSPAPCHPASFLRPGRFCCRSGWVDDSGARPGQRMSRWRPVALHPAAQDLPVRCRWKHPGDSFLPLPGSRVMAQFVWTTVGPVTYGPTKVSRLRPGSPCALIGIGVFIGDTLNVSPTA